MNICDYFKEIHEDIQIKLLTQIYRSNKKYFDYVPSVTLGFKNVLNHISNTQLQMNASLKTNIRDFIQHFLKQINQSIKKYLSYVT